MNAKIISWIRLNLFFLVREKYFGVGLICELEYTWAYITMHLAFEVITCTRLTESRTLYFNT